MEIKILQWNIWYKESPQKISQLITEINPDIACLQELTTTSAYNKNIDIPLLVSQALNKANYYYQSAQDWNFDQDIRDQGNGIFTKFPLVSKRYEYVQQPTQNPTDFSKEGRVYVEVTLDINGKNLTIGTVHLSYTDRFLQSKAKEKEVQNLLEIIKTKKENYILTGDFNTPPDSQYIKQVQKYLKNCGPDYFEKTWTTKPFKKGDFFEDQLNWRLDYFFATKGINVKEAKVIKTEVSDHLPLVVSIDV